MKYHELDINEKEITGEKIEELYQRGYRAIFLHSPKGTAKTKAAVQLSQALEKRLGRDYRLVAPSHRRSLVAQLSTRFEGTAYTDSKFDRASKKVVTIDSIYRLGATGDSLVEPLSLLFQDEYGQAMSHMTGDTCKANREWIVESYKLNLMKAGRILAVDADFYPEAIEAITIWGNLAPSQVLVVHNKVKTVGKKFLVQKKKEAILALIEQGLRKGNRDVPFIATDSKGEAKVIKETLTQKFPSLKILLICGETSSQPDQAAFISNPDVEADKWDVVITTPSVGTGVSIEGKRFNKVFLIVTNEQCTEQDVLQHCSRVRNVKVINCFIAAKNRKAPTNPLLMKAKHKSEVLNAIRSYGRFKTNQKKESVANEVGGELLISAHIRYDVTTQEAKVEFEDETYLDLKFKVMARRNDSLNNLRYLVIEAMKKEGTVVEQDTITEKAEKGIKTERTELKKRLKKIKKELLKATKVNSPEDNTTLLNKRKSGWVTEDEQLQLEKFRYARAVGFNDTLIEKVLEANLDELEKMVSIQSIIRANKEALQERDITHLKENNYTTDVYQSYIVRELYDYIVNQSQISLLPNIRYCSADLTLFAQAVYSRASEVQDKLGLTIYENLKEKPMQFFRSFIERLGYKLDHKQVRQGKDRVTYYWITQTSYDNVTEIMSQHSPIQVEVKEDFEVELPF